MRSLSKIIRTPHTKWEVGEGLRPGSHYGENHNDGDGNIYGDGKKCGESVTHKTFLSS